MAIVTLDGVGQSASAVSGQSTTYIVDKVLSRMPAVPDTLVNSELQDVLRHFYTMSTGWRQNIGPYTVAANVSTIYLNPVDQYTQIQRVLDVWLYPSVNGAQFPQRLVLVPRQVVGADVAPPSTAWMQYPDQLVLYPVPDKTYGSILYAYSVLMPVINTTQLPNIAMTDHLDALMWGTMARLYAMKGKPWADGGLAMSYKKDYTQEIRRVRDEANRAYSGAQGPMRFPAFAPRKFVGSPIAVAG
jgi:hypothetical protein